RLRSYLDLARAGRHRESSLAPCAEPSRVEIDEPFAHVCPREREPRPVPATPESQFPFTRDLQPNSTCVRASTPAPPRYDQREERRREQADDERDLESRRSRTAELLFLGVGIGYVRRDVRADGGPDDHRHQQTNEPDGEHHRLAACFAGYVER